MLERRAAAPGTMQEIQIRPAILAVRCLVQEYSDRWEAFSLEFGLAAQADTEAEVKQKLQAMISSYLYDALAGEDRAYAVDLLARRATASVYAKYYFTKFLRNLGGRDGRNDDRHDRRGVYSSTLPMAPMGC